MISQVSAAGQKDELEDDCALSGEDFDSDELEGSMDSDEEPRRQ